ncbi:MAG: hypothetical protein IPL92_19315 [Saprospiraceae bacterium]|nr:hypothetical protein [Candidatus Opimibacter iunctus]
MANLNTKIIASAIFFLASNMSLQAQKSSYFTAIHNANIQIKCSLNNTPLAWATDTIDILVNKQTGEFTAKLLVDNLHFATSNAEFKGGNGENSGKYLVMTGIIPVDEVLANSNNAIDRKVEITSTFNDQEYISTFLFTILKMPSGFSVMANGTISHSALEIENLEDLEDELVIIISFTGY